MSFLGSYRNVRQTIRDTTPLWLRQGLLATQPAILAGYGAEKAVGSLISNDAVPGQPGYIPTNETTGPVNGPANPGDGSTVVDPNAGGGGSTGGGSTGGGSTANLQNYLDMISAQSDLMGQQYQGGIIDTNAQYAGGVARARGGATQGINDINSNMADFQKTSDTNLQKTNQSAGQALANTEVGMRNNFASRGALDSTFYSKALRGGLTDIKTQQNDQVNYITDQLTTAKKNAQKQKDSITNQLYDALDQLQLKKESALKDLENQYNQGTFSLQQLQAAADADVTKFATPAEVQNLAKLHSQSVNVDDMISQIDASAKATVGQIQTQNNTAVNTNMDMTNVQNLLTKLGQGLSAGVRKADFIPMLTSQGYSPEDAQALLDKAEQYSTTFALAPSAA